MPTNWNKQKVYVRRLNAESTVMDERHREPAAEPMWGPDDAGENPEPPETFMAQMHFDKQEKRARQRAGNVPETAGRLVYGNDVDALSQGDRIVGYDVQDKDGSIRVQDCEYTICGEPERKGHLRGASRVVRSLFIESSRYVAR